MVLMQSFMQMARFTQTVKVQELPGEQAGGFKVSGHATFLGRGLDHVIELRPIDLRVLLTDVVVPAEPREPLVHKLGAITGPKIFDGFGDVGQQFHRSRGYVGSTLDPEGVEPSHARLAIPHHDQVHPPSQ